MDEAYGSDLHLAKLTPEFSRFQATLGWRINRRLLGQGRGTVSAWAGQRMEGGMKEIPQEAEFEAQRCVYVAKEGSLSWGNCCILKRGHSGAHVHGTPRWERPDHHRDTIIGEVVIERQRQIGAEGFTTSADDAYPRGTLGMAGACYALPPGLRAMTEMSVPFAWPWPAEWWKPAPPENRRRDYIKALALILAEVEALDRAEDAKGIIPDERGDIIPEIAQ